VSVQSLEYFLSNKKMRLFEAVRKAIGLKPTLNYLEIHLADHCNLNCKGCSHFSPLAQKQFTDIKSYKKDMGQLHLLFASIHKLVLLGGEPLLNSQINEFLNITRSFFSKSKIIIVTNGSLLPKMPEEFWKTCKACSVDIDISIYPPLKSKESYLIELVKEKNLRVSVHLVDSFQAFYNPKGDTFVKQAFKTCQKRMSTPMLKEGKIYICPKPATINYFNQKFGLKLPDSGFVDIYSSILNGWKIKEFLNKPSSICSFCTLGWDVVPTFPWENSKLELTDWQAHSQASQKKQK
jgi:organic radical activating enzyme